MIFIETKNGEKFEKNGKRPHCDRGTKVREYPLPKTVGIRLKKKFRKKEKSAKAYIDKQRSNVHPTCPV